MRVLVTGGSGFIGGTLVREFLKKKFEVHALINRSSEFKFDSELEKPAQILSVDIRDAGGLKNLSTPDEFDVLIHTAGLAHQFGECAEKDFWEINVEGTKNIAEWAVGRSVKHFILLSSVAVYGKSKATESNAARHGLTEESECRPEGIYARTKLESENVARQICELNQMPLTVLRPATVIGENDRGNVFRLIKAIDRGRFVWIGKGKNLKSLIYKGDVAEACLNVLARKNGTEIFNITADAMPMKEIVEEIHRRLGRKIPRFSISPNILDKLFRANRKTLNARRINKLSETVQKWLADDVFSGEKFHKTCDFQTATPIKEAIGREVEIYRREK